MKKIINLTPHSVNIIKEGGEKITIPSSGIARCTQTTSVVGDINGIPLTTTTFGDVEGLPLEEKNIFFIVSRLVLSACKDRHDLLVPNELVRDENGNIIGCRSLANN